MHPRKTDREPDPGKCHRLVGIFICFFLLLALPNPARSDPQVDPAALNHSIEIIISQVPEFRALREEAKRLGIRIWFQGNLAVLLADRAREDLGQAQKQGHTLQSLFPARSPLELVIDGPLEAAEEIKAFLGNNEDMAIRLLRSKDNNPGILNNPHLMNSAEAFLVELTAPPAGESQVRDALHWNSKATPTFLQDQARGALTYQAPEKDISKGDELLGILNYLDVSLRTGLEADPEALKRGHNIFTNDIDGIQKKYGDFFTTKFKRKLGNIFANAKNPLTAWKTTQAVGLFDLTFPGSTDLHDFTNAAPPTPGAFVLPEHTKTKNGAHSLPLQKLITEQELRQLAEDLAPKVNLFADTWKKNPAAEFYGGTTRDYLYWIMGQFRGVTSRADAEQIMKRLRSLSYIQIRDFIIHESDVDVVSDDELNLESKDYGVKKLDYIRAERFDTRTDAGKNEIDQGFIPLEKIRLSSKGFVKWPQVGDGIHEIYTDKLSVHFTEPEVFAETRYAKQKLNHPVLMALRYLRLQAIDYYKRHGGGLPDKNILLGSIDPHTAAIIRKIIHDATVDGSLEDYLKQPKFREWLNATIRKVFVSYTNPTAGKVLLDWFGVSALVARYPELNPYNQFLFAPYRDAGVIEQQLSKDRVDRHSFFQPVEEYFPDKQFFHGTKTNEAFRNILFQGVLPSDHGYAGDGLYGVARSHIAFAENWGGTPDRVVRFEILPTAKLVDITTGEGKRVWEEYVKQHGKKLDLETDFANHYGIDILRYEYGDTIAFVVKNSQALSRPVGHNVQLLTFSELAHRAEKISSEPELKAFLKIMQINRPSTSEMNVLFSILSAHQRNSDLAAILHSDPHTVLDRRFLPLILDLFGLHPALDARLQSSFLVIFLQELKSRGAEAVTKEFEPRLEGADRQLLSVLRASVEKQLSDDLRLLSPEEALAKIFTMNANYPQLASGVIRLAGELLHREALALKISPQRPIPPYWHTSFLDHFGRLDRVAKNVYLEKIVPVLLEQKQAGVPQFLTRLMEKDPQSVLNRILPALTRKELWSIPPAVKAKFAIHSPQDLLKVAALAQRLKDPAQKSFGQHMPSLADFEPHPDSPLLRSIRYLIAAFSLSSPMAEKDIVEISSLWQKVKKQQITLNTAEIEWLKNNAQQLILHAYDLEHAKLTLTKMGILEPLIHALGGTSVPQSAAWWLGRRELPTPNLAQRAAAKGKTAAELRITRVYHPTQTAEAYRSITRSGGKPNILISKANYPDLHASWGDGFYTSKIAPDDDRWGKFHVRMTVDPQAREGVDFKIAGEQIIFMTNCLEVTSPSMDAISGLVGLAEELNAGSKSALFRALEQFHNAGSGCTQFYSAEGMTH